MTLRALRPEADSWLEPLGVRLSDAQWDRLSAYVEDILAYQDRANVTAAQTAEEILRRHLLDALAAASALRARLDAASPEVLDAGAGGGFVGICMKILWPEARVSFAEATYRKCCFLNWTLSRLGLPARVLQNRLEDLPRRSFDAVLARALAPLGEALALCAPLCRQGGLLGVFQSELPQAAPAQRDQAPSPLAPLEPFGYRLPGEKRDRHLLFFRLLK